uniref:Dynein attachment factor N-terminal domain-containing protein n=1 Tax=Oryzias latipes TaxID=8090 RepID=A0A3P9MIN2_ORYLA
MSQRDVIDFLALERELKAAVESDRRYDRENEAKLRAVHQGVSYEQFRNLVLSSHLKPLEKKVTDGAPRKQPWNPVVPNQTCPFQSLLHSSNWADLWKLQNKADESHNEATGQSIGRIQRGALDDTGDMFCRFELLLVSMVMDRLTDEVRQESVDQDVFR